MTVLDAFESAASMRLVELRAVTGFASSRLLRLLGTLEACGYVVAVGRGAYALGPKVFRLGWVLRDSFGSMLSVIRPVLERAVTETGATAFFSIQRGMERVVLCKNEPALGVRFVIEEGEARPLHVGATGRVILAHMPRDDVEQLLNAGDFAALTSTTMTDPTALRQSLEAIRSEGYAVSYGEATSQAFAIAVPILSRDKLVGALSLAGPIDEYASCNERCLSTLKREAEFLSTRLA